MLELDILALGFTAEEIEKIENHFLCTFTLKDWESILVFEDTEGAFKYSFLEQASLESMAETLLEMGRISSDELAEGQTPMSYMLSRNELLLELPGGGWALLTDELLRKEVLSQID